MTIKKEGHVLELDPNKDYIMFVKIGSILEKSVRNRSLIKRSGSILFVGDLNEFRFVENSDKIVDVILEDN